MLFGKSNRNQEQVPQNPAAAGGGYAPEWSGGYAGPAAGAGSVQGGAPGPDPWAGGMQAQMGSMPGAGGYAQQGASSWNGNQPGQTGYMPGQTGYPPYSGGAGSWMPAQNNGNAGQIDGYSAASGGYPPAGGYSQAAGSSSFGGYPQAGGYGAAGGYPSGNQAGGGSWMPQGYPQSQQGGGYAYPQMNPQAGQAPGYGGAPQGYPSYFGAAQMGRQPVQDGRSQIPLNGGGYVPPPRPVRKQPFVFQSWMLIALGALLIGIFAVSLLVLPRPNALQWVFIVLAAASVAFFWIRPLVTGNRRMCYTIIFAMLSVVMLLSALGVLTPRRDATRTPGSGTPTATTQAPQSQSVVIDPSTGLAINTVEQEVVTASPAPQEDNSTVERLDSFFRFWAANREDEMLALCSPTWQSSVDSPPTALFGLKANRTPLDYEIENVSGTSEDSSRTVTVTSTMDRNNGKDPVKYRLSVLMVKENGVWYVDPQSLKTYEKEEATDPNLTATPSPSPEPLVNAATVLYYNPDGGSMYHLDPNCKSTHAKFLPFKGHFTYGEINDDKYVKLSPCNVCGAPLRP